MHRSIPALSLALGLVLALPAKAQFAPPPPDCIRPGFITLGGFETRIVAGKLETPSLVFEYVVTLTAARPMRFVNVLFTAPNAPLVSLAPDLPAGVQTRVSLGQRNGPALSESDLRNGLRVTCTPL
ncbi:hypothetical protein [Sediminicoccus sp. BL-A-41-H5]|uniref:hypothetical protein n=1 Tax=Sediminicoccus sp. BL-A-41-H5 TaxID=3421106 RepID=UPI003D66F902